MLGVTPPELPERQIASLPQGIMVDLERREIWRGNTRSHLIPTEGLAMRDFLENRGRVMPFEELVFLIKGDEVTEEEAPEIMRPIINHLRKKLDVFPGMEKWIKSVRGIGYIFEVGE